MRFITFQPKKVLDTLNSCGEIKAKGSSIGEKIFCVEVNKFTRQQLFITAPTFPQVAITFDADDAQMVDAVCWVNHLVTGIPYKSRNNCKWKEYVVPRIKSNQIVRVDTISTSSDSTIVQQDYLDYHYDWLCELSDLRWKKFELESFPSYDIYSNFIINCMNCISPFFYGK